MRRGASRAPAMHLPAILEGFRHMASVLVRNRSAILAPKGPLAAMAGHPARFVFRSSTEYFSLLNRAFQCASLRDGAQRGLNLALPMALARCFPRGQAQRSLRQILAAEQRALARADLPRFVVRTDSDRLWLGPGSGIPHMFSGNSYERARLRFRALSPRDLAAQVRIIRSRLAKEFVLSLARPPKGL